METYRREGFRPLTGINFNGDSMSMFFDIRVSVPSRG